MTDETKSVDPAAPRSPVTETISSIAGAVARAFTGSPATKYAPECGDVGETGEAGDLGSNAD